MAPFEFDPTIFDPVVADFVAKFYELANWKETMKEFSECFTEDALMVRAQGNVSGRKGLLKLNEKTWEGVVSRKHNIIKGFVLSATASKEVMLYGWNDYVYEDGTKGRKDWGSRMRLRRSESGEILVEEYQSYSTALMKTPW